MANIPKGIHLILGASGGVGKELFRSLKEKKLSVVGTYCNNQSDPEFLYFDTRKQTLSEFISKHLSNDPSRIAWIYIFFGRPVPNWIFYNPEESQLLHVNSTISIIEEANKLGLPICYASAEYIFEGNLGGYSESDPTFPTTLYGKQKKTVEEYIRNQVKDYIITRLAYSISDDPSGICPINATYASLLQPGARMAEDTKFCIVTVKDVCRAIYKLIEIDCRGIFHIASSHIISRFDLATKIKAFSRFKDKMSFEPCSLDDLDFPETRPKKTWLKNDKLVNVTGIQFKDPNDIIKEKTSILDSYQLEGA
jgi:dTDP-4-dehydrorhamnose reductase